MRLMVITAGMGLALACVSAESVEAQTPSWTVDLPGPATPATSASTVSDLLIQLNHRMDFLAPGEDVGPVFDSAISFSDPAETGSPRAVMRRDVWFDNLDFVDRLSLRTEGAVRRADGAPVPLNPRDPAALEPEHYDLSYSRGWPATLGYTPSGLEVTLTPHAGVGLGTLGGSAEAGATLTIGADLDRLVPEGSAAFGQRARWYVYAAGSGRAVGYNFARTRDGDFARSGVSHDSGSFMGDASLGVAYRRGGLQGSLGLVYRELGPSDVRMGDGVDNDVSEGLVAFQLSIRPRW